MRASWAGRAAIVVCACSVRLAAPQPSLESLHLVNPGDWTVIPDLPGAGGALVLLQGAGCVMRAA